MAKYPFLLLPTLLLLQAALLAQETGRQETGPQKAKAVNHLANETSPYLISHQHNPVDWYPWGKEALLKAKKEDKPIFLSIGYSACHWCHVMERESFENQEIAKLMNEHFVNIKVDREERPDLDEIYMAAVQRMSGGRGGWPMSVFLTPELEPFYGGTYYPPEDRGGMPGFRRVLKGLAKAYREQREEIQKDAARLVADLKQSLAPALAAGELKLEVLDGAVGQSQGHFDHRYGGFGQPPVYAPKFPHAAELSVLLHQHARKPGGRTSLQIAETTLQHMALGGIYDQLGGGFHRYSTDRHWLVPHFEKMLYDNALLVRPYLEAHLLTGRQEYAVVARETLDYLLREMQDKAGGFYSTTDADSEGVEGKFFVWDVDEVQRVLGADSVESRIVLLHFGIEEKGNWHEMPGKTVLSQVKSLAAVAKELKLEEGVVRQKLLASRDHLLGDRSKRVPPATDDKVLAAWNGMAIRALAMGYEVLGEERYLKGAQRAADFLLREMRGDDGRLRRSWRQGKAKLQAYLDDYAYCAEALIALFEADFDPRWLEAAKDLLGQMRRRFLDPKDGNFFFTALDHEKLLARSKSVTESSTPSGTALAVLAFLRGGLLLGDLELVEIGRQALRANHAYISRYPGSVSGLLLGVDFMLSDPREVVLVGEPGDPNIQAFLKTLRRRFPKHHVVALLHSGNEKAMRELSKVFDGKTLVQGRPAAYVCREGVCEVPVTDPGKLKFD